ncbi:hypothetical protein ZIOFF_005426 [Zingiber officinale]|uniref:Uncharacterized protein n=1 Tax=Zingiber officinale TaxID=94328 RepID=A0A8J5M1K0_ZINOF|nr:hypothetical protein ZIOFF_005426 [Zingiber officinale]
MNHLHRIIEIGDVQCVLNLRMNQNTFARLCYLLTHVGGLVESRYVRIEEKVAMFLSILAHHKKNRVAGHDYIRSGHTISTHFHEVLRSILLLHPILLVKPSPVDHSCTNEPWKWFKGCLGALDGTYVNVHVPSLEKGKYITRKATIAVNVLGVCDKDMNFIYALTGWEGSAADARVLRDALTRDDTLKVPRVRYHRDAWGNRAVGPQNYKELFNWRHSQARNVIERAFGLLKKRWAILRSPSFYPLKTQNRIILACMLLHNFIRSEMPDDPIEEVNDEDIDNFISMENGATSQNCAGKGKKTDKTRRGWSEREEEVLIQALKEAITEGWKSCNGFRAGYLGFLEHRMKAAFPETNLRGNPHINSKVHVWKKMYGNLVTILSKSGVGWNDTEKTIEASNETWDALIMVDNNARAMKHKRWTYYNDWCEIFGNDRATGENSEHFTSTVQDVLNKMNVEVPNSIGMNLEDLFPLDEGAAESMFVSVIPSSKPTASVQSKGKKRKQVDDGDDAIVEAINNFADITKNTMTELIKQLATEASNEKMSIAQDKVLDAMEKISELTENEKVSVTELLVDNHNKLSLFLRLGHGGRLSLARKLLRGG